MIQIVAELGINWGGYPDVLQDMVWAAADAGCTGVKVQSCRVGDFLPEGHPDWDMFAKCELGPLLFEAVDWAHTADLQIGTTPTSLEGVQEAVEAGCDFLKNGSDFLLRTDLIQAMLDTGLPTWVSTGMATFKEIIHIPDGAKKMLCTSLYPCPDDQANLRRQTPWPRNVPQDFTPHQWFDGYSDHTQGTVAATVVAALGVEMIEKHFTLDKNADGPDHHFSADPKEMAQLVHDVRRVETMMGPWPCDIGPTLGELENRDKWRVTEGALRTG